MSPVNYGEQDLSEVWGLPLGNKSPNALGKEHSIEEKSRAHRGRLPQAVLLRLTSERDGLLPF
jgi:hypothetical protein